MDVLVAGAADDQGFAVACCHLLWSFRRRTWCAVVPVRDPQSSQVPAVSRVTSSAGRFLQIGGRSSLRTTLVVLRASDTPPQQAASGLRPSPRSIMTRRPLRGP